MKIADTIYTPFQNDHFWPVLTLSNNFRKTISIGSNWNNWKKKSPLLIERQNIIYIDLLNHLFLAEQLFWNTADDDVKQHTQ